MIGKMKKLYCNYDERITNVYKDAMEKIGDTPPELISNKVMSSVLVPFFHQAEENVPNVRITFGTEHRDYRHFTNVIPPKLPL